MLKAAIGLLIILTAMSCQNSTQAGDNNSNQLPRPKINLKEGCVPESNLLAKNILQGTPVGVEDTDARSAVMIIAANSEDVLGLCTAQLIGPKVILTAAHCLPSKATRFFVIFHPSLSCESGFNLSRDSVRAKRVVPHENFDENSEPDQMNSDIGLIFLNEDAPESYKPYKIINPEEMPPQLDLHLYGYGRVGEKAGGAGILRKAVVPPSKYSIDLYQRKVTIEQENSTGICVGDSGGAGFVEINGEKQILGVNSYVRGTKDDRCIYNGYQVLAHPYRDWIESKIQQNEAITEVR